MSANVTVTNAAAGGFLSPLSRRTSRPRRSRSTLGFRAGQTRANNALVGLASDGSGAFKITSTAAGPVDVVVDVNGWFE